MKNENILTNLKNKKEYMEHTAGGRKEELIISHHISPEPIRQIQCTQSINQIIAKHPY